MGILPYLWNAVSCRVAGTMCVALGERQVQSILNEIKKVIWTDQHHLVTNSKR